MAWPKGKSRKMSSEPENEKDEAETPDTVAGSPVEVADLEEAELAATDPVTASNATKFFFGHVGAYKIGDGEVYHAKTHHVLITDPDLAAKITALSKIPSNQIFITE